MRPTIYVMLLALLLISCVSLQNIGNNNDQFIPSIGAIGLEKNSLSAKSFSLIGSPNLEKGIPLSIRQIPFDKNIFRTYSNLRAKQGKQPTVAYFDSLPVKPKYFCLEIADRIALRTQLNSDDNAEVRSYLANDEDLKIVSQIVFIDVPEKTRQLLEAEGIFLTECKDGLLSIETLQDGRRKPFDMDTMEIFDYKLSGFCWGSDRYGNARIASISAEGEKCPKGSEKDYRRLNEPKDYLKR